MTITSLVSCKKDDPDSGTKEEIFKLDAEVGSSTINFIAGKNNYYMHTDYLKDSNDIFCFSGTLGDFNLCNSTDLSNCSNALSITIRDNKTADSQTSNVQESIQSNSYDYRGPVTGVVEGYTVQFQSNIWGGGNYIYQWDFGDGNSSSSLNPSHFYDASNPNVEPCLTVTDLTTGLTSKLCNPINLESDCIPSFEYDISASTSYVVIFKNTLFGSFGILPPLWKEGNGNFSAVQPVILSSHPVTKVCAKDSTNQCLNMKCMNIIPDSVAHQGIANFDFNYTPVIDYSSTDFSKITIVWYDENGKKYESNKYQQPSTSYFTINETSNYKINVKGSSTKKIDIEFSCILFGDNLFDQIEINNASGIFGLAHP